MPTSTPKTIALAGASGTLGTPMLHALLHSGFTVTVLTRHTSTATFPLPAQVLRVSYSNKSELITALQNQEVLISTLTTSSIPLQKTLIDAAITAGVQRFLPSEFGSDASIPAIRAMPMYAPKIEVETYLRERCAEADVEMTWTAVYCSCFLDWGIDQKFYLDLEEKNCTLYDGGDFKTATSPTDWVGEAVAAILKDRFEETADREVRISGFEISQRELLDITKGVVGSEGWVVEEGSSESIFERAMGVYKDDPGDVCGWVWGMLVRGVFGEGYSRDFGGKMDNEWLGLRGISREEVEGYVRRAVEMGKAGKVF